MVIKQLDEAYLPADDGRAQKQPSRKFNGRLQRLGLDEVTCADALNPGWVLQKSDNATVTMTTF